MNRHAYLIMAHNNWEQLRLLLNSLDHPQNGIFLHIDKKAVAPADKEIRKYVTYSSIQIYREISVFWGGDTQIKCELLLLKHAVNSHYDYYHLLTGVDIPLVKQSEIYSFFEDQAGKNYIGFTNNHTCEDRVRYYYFFQNHIGRPTETSPVSVKIYAKAQKFLLKLQKLLHIDRIKRNPYKCYKGSAYFSITHDAAAFLTDNAKSIMKSMGRSIGGDEMFVQTAIMNSPYADTVVNNNLRYTDWSESDQPGAPKTFTMKDYDAIVSSGKLFARKFDENKDMDIIRKLYSNID